MRLNRRGMAGRPRRLEKNPVNPFWALVMPSGPTGKGGLRTMPEVSMTVNGRAVCGAVEGRTMLAGFLRETLGLTGTHTGCETTQCGACVVHVNGLAMKSCTMLALQCEGAAITT